MVKHIIFDLGGVIIKHKTTIIKDILSKMPLTSAEDAFNIWLKQQSRLLKGEIGSKEFLNELKSSGLTDASLDELERQWSNHYKDEAATVDWELLEFIKTLKTKFNIVLMTDTIDVHDEHNRERNIYQAFHRVFKSHQEKLAKSEGAEAFLNVLQKLEANPSECIFVDDHMPNIEVANSLGINGILYKNLNNLKNQLKTFGIT